VSGPRGTCVGSRIQAVTGLLPSELSRLSAGAWWQVQRYPAAAGPSHRASGAVGFRTDWHEVEIPGRDEVRTELSAARLGLLSRGEAVFHNLAGSALTAERLVVDADMFLDTASSAIAPPSWALASASPSSRPFGCLVGP
jgi:hypothetical protein